MSLLKVKLQIPCYYCGAIYLLLQEKYIFRIHIQELGSFAEKKLLPWVCGLHLLREITSIVRRALTITTVRRLTIVFEDPFPVSWDMTTSKCLNFPKNLILVPPYGRWPFLSRVYPSPTIGLQGWFLSMIGWFCESYYKIREGMGRDETGGGRRREKKNEFLSIPAETVLSNYYKQVSIYWGSFSGCKRLTLHIMKFLFFSL